MPAIQIGRTLIITEQIFERRTDDRNPSIDSNRASKFAMTIAATGPELFNHAPPVRPPAVALPHVGNASANRR